MKQLTDFQKRTVAAQCVHVNLKRAVRNVTQRYDRALEDSGLRITQFSLLVASSLRGAAPITELAERLEMDRTTLTRNLKPLARQGLIETFESKADARVRMVQVTPAGETAIAQAYPLWQQAQVETTQGFTAHDYKALLEYLERL